MAAKKQLAMFSFFDNDNVIYAAEITPSFCFCFNVKDSLCNELQKHYRALKELQRGDLIIWSPNGREEIPDNRRFPFDVTAISQIFEGTFTPSFLSILAGSTSDEPVAKKLRICDAGGSSGILKAGSSIARHQACKKCAAIVSIRRFVNILASKLDQDLNFDNWIESRIFGPGTATYGDLLHVLRKENESLPEDQQYTGEVGRILDRRDWLALTALNAHANAQLHDAELEKDAVLTVILPLPPSESSSKLSSDQLTKLNTIYNSGDRILQRIAVKTGILNNEDNLKVTFTVEHEGSVSGSSDPGHSQSDSSPPQSDGVDGN